MLDYTLRILATAFGMIGVVLLVSGNWLGCLFLLAAALVILWLANVIQRFWLELIGIGLLITGVVLGYYDIWPWGLAALLVGLVACWGRTWWPYVRDTVKAIWLGYP